MVPKIISKELIKSMSNPLVSIICLCYNHEKYVLEALNSCLQQTYYNIQLIIVDDASSDKSVKVIEEFVVQHPEVEFIPNDQNIGNCRSFNKALVVAKGEFIIDLAADDVLLPKRVEVGVNELRNKGKSYGVHFSDALLVNENGISIHQFYERNESGDIIKKIPQGNVFRDVLKSYFICPPTVMFRKQVIEEMGGYDETLAYEDFDFWVRSSRAWKYCFSDQVLVKKRELDNSLGKKQYVRGSKQLESTFRVCEKAFHLCKNSSEYKSLKKRIKYELKHAIWLGNWPVSLKYIRLYSRL